MDYFDLRCDNVTYNVKCTHKIVFCLYQTYGIMNVYLNTEIHTYYINTMIMYTNLFQYSLQFKKYGIMSNVQNHLMPFQEMFDS